MAEKEGNFDFTDFPDWILNGIKYGNPLLIVLSVLYLVEQLCPTFLKSIPYIERISYRIPSTTYGSYIAYGLILFCLVIYRRYVFKNNVFVARLEDPSEVRAIFVEADTIEPRDGMEESVFSAKKRNLEVEKKRIEGITETQWTEYEILSINQLLVDFLKPEELKARALSCLEDLQEYADDSATRYSDQEHYGQWENRIENAIDKIEAVQKKNAEEADQIEKATEPLRAELKTLLEHIADYDRYWAHGSAVVRGVMSYGAVAIPLLIAMALLPLYHPLGGMHLGIFNWGILGVAGALTALLRDVYQTDLVEVGNTRGKQILWRAALGATLGFVAGILLFSMIAGEILMGKAFPSSPSVRGETPDVWDTTRAIFWGITSGFSFEFVLRRMANSASESV